MEKTKENKKMKKGKHREKLKIGDIIFRVLMIVGISLITVMTYIFYIRGI